MVTTTLAAMLCLGNGTTLLAPSATYRVTAYRTPHAYLAGSSGDFNHKAGVNTFWEVDLAKFHSRSAQLTKYGSIMLTGNDWISFEKKDGEPDLSIRFRAPRNPDQREGATYELTESRFAKYAVRRVSASPNRPTALSLDLGGKNWVFIVENLG